MSVSAALTRAAGFGSYFEVDLTGDVPDFDVDTAPVPPNCGPPRHRCSTALLARAPLAGRMSGPITAARRRSCCLFYRTAAARTCGDCPLPKVPA